MSVHTKIETRFRDAGEFESAMSVAGIPCTPMQNLSMKDGSSCNAAYNIVIGSEPVCAWQLRPESAFQFQSAGWWFSNRAVVGAIANLDSARIRQITAEKQRREEDEQREAERRRDEARTRERLAEQAATEARRAEEARRATSRAAAIAEADAILANAGANRKKSNETLGVDAVYRIDPSDAAKLALGRILQGQARIRLKAAEDELAARGFALISEQEDDEEALVLTWRG